MAAFVQLFLQGENTMSTRTQIILAVAFALGLLTAGAVISKTDAPVRNVQIAGLAP
jgi:hypothetical protein